jgi:hypothetical protein
MKTSHWAIFGVRPLSKFDLIDVLAAIKAGGDVDLIRRGAEMLYQALIGAGRFE